MTSESPESYSQSLDAADELYRITNELFAADGDHVSPLEAIIASYESARGRPDLTRVPEDVREAIEAADELADWLRDFIKVQVEPTTEQWKSFMGVWGALVHYEGARAAVEST